MIFVDSSVWIDYFNGAVTQQTDALDRLLSTEPVATGDLNLTEVLQGFRTDRDFERAEALLLHTTIIDIGGVEIATEAARHYRALRRRGITVRKTIDALIAARCIRSGLTLLHNDRDFDPFAEHLGLRVYA